MMACLTSLMLRITPACAGKRKRECTPKMKYGDHPRVCGEKLWLGLVHRSCIGSPPRVRGKETRHFRLLLPSGITPACAGKSHSCAMREA